MCSFLSLVQDLSNNLYANRYEPNALRPIINKSQLKRAKSLISEAKANGSNIALEGTIEGNIITPYIFRDIDNNSTLAQTELFSPVVSIIKVETDEEAINIANDTEYGLSTALFTNDIESGKKYALQIDSGMTHINDQTINDSPDVPLGGNKSSGLGRYGNPWVIDELTKPKWISTQAQYRKFPFQTVNCKIINNDQKMIDMPTYQVYVKEGQFNAGQKKQLANSITDAHSEATGAPKYFVQAVFHEVI